VRTTHSPEDIPVAVESASAVQVPLRPVYTTREPLPPLIASEIDEFEREAARYLAGQYENPDDFKRFRLVRGIYGQIQPGVQMVRIKIPSGVLNAEQLDRLGGLAAESPRGVGHLTTRQNIQYHFIPLEDCPNIMRRLAEVGLTTREACGNTIRTITSCYLAGVCGSETFDVTPYARAVTRYFLRRGFHTLPRKFKIAFSGCPIDCAFTAIHDFGAVAAVRKREDGTTERGFRVYLGGGLGPTPRVAKLLEEFTPADDLIPTAQAVLQVFDRMGNRKDRNRARLKFVVDKLGIEEFRRVIFEEREKVRAEIGRTPPTLDPADEEGPPAQRHPAIAPTGASAEGTPAYAGWKATNVWSQRQPGYSAVHIRFVLGDITAAQFRALADVVRRFGVGGIRVTQTQNFVLRWVQDDDLPALYEALAAAGMALPGAETVVDVTCGPGGDTCQLGVTLSRGLALAVSKRLEALNGQKAELKGVRIKISGCPNSCGQHHIATIGLFGGANKIGARHAPYYNLLLGGATEESRANFGRMIGKIPAKRGPEVVLRLFELYRAERRDGESFHDFIVRVETARVTAAISEVVKIDPAAPDPGLFRDWGAEKDFVLVGGMKGECAV
jgi:sulfite reductase beta subunit-like hemoprotein